MDDYHHNRYFKDIQYNTDPSTAVAPWTRPKKKTHRPKTRTAAQLEVVAEIEEEEEVVVPPWLFGLSSLYEARIEAVLRSSSQTAAYTSSPADDAAAGGGGDGAWLLAEGTRHVRDMMDLAEVDEYSHVVLWHDTDFSRIYDSRPPFKVKEKDEGK